MLRCWRKRWSSQNRRASRTAMLSAFERKYERIQVYQRRAASRCMLAWLPSCALAAPRSGMWVSQVEYTMNCALCADYRFLYTLADAWTMSSCAGLHPYASVRPSAGVTTLCWTQRGADHLVQHAAPHGRWSCAHGVPQPSVRCAGTRHAWQALAQLIMCGSSCPSLCSACSLRPHCPIANKIVGNSSAHGFMVRMQQPIGK